MQLFSHPQSVGMSYVQHMCCSLNLSRKFLAAALAAAIHAFWPDVLQTYSSDTLEL